MWLNQVSLVQAPPDVATQVSERPVELQTMSDVAEAPAAVLDAAERACQLITLHGRPVAAVIGVDPDEIDASLYAQVVTSTEFNRQLATILADLTETSVPVLVTRYNRPRAVVVRATITPADEVALMRGDPELEEAILKARESARQTGTFELHDASEGGYQRRLIPPLDGLIEEFESVGLETDGLQSLMDGMSQEYRELVGKAVTGVLELLCQDESQPIYCRLRDTCFRLEHVEPQLADR